MTYTSPQRLITLLSFSLCILTGSVSTATANAPHPSSVELDESLYFITASGDPLQMAPGHYNVEDKEDWLQLTPLDGERFDAVLIEAKQVVHEEDFSEPHAFLASSSEDHPDIQHLVLYVAGGTAYEAMGSKSGVWPRGWWSSVKKTAKKVGRGAKRVGKKVGSGVKRGAKAVGRAGKKVGRGVKRGAKAVGSGIKRGAKAVGGGIKKGAKGVVAAATTIRNQVCPSDPKPKKPFINTDPRKYREPDSFNLNLAYRWAPVHYQDSASNGKADYITNFDYDNDWVATNNWDNLHRAPLRAYMYYSVTETKTHWFIMYASFHPRDYAACIPTGKANAVGEHENDMEGAVAIVRKTKSRYGQLEGMVTVYHHDFYSYTPKGSPLRSGKEDIDGMLYMVKHRGALHPMTAQEAQGHGLKAWPQVAMSRTHLLIRAATGGLVNTDLAKKPQFRGGDGIIYYPSTVTRQIADIPKNKNDRYVEYALIDFHGRNGVWNHRKDPKTVITDGKGDYNTKFRGDKSNTCGGGKADAKYCQTNSANAPWGWDDVGDPVIGKGDGIAKGVIATDPAKLINRYFKGLGKFSREYSHNPYTPW